MGQVCGVGEALQAEETACVVCKVLRQQGAWPEIHEVRQTGPGQLIPLLRLLVNQGRTKPCFKCMTQAAQPRGHLHQGRQTEVETTLRVL